MKKSNKVVQLSFLAVMSCAFLTKAFAVAMTEYACTAVTAGTVVMCSQYRLLGRPNNSANAPDDLLCERVHNGGVEFLCDNNRTWIQQQPIQVEPPVEPVHGVVA